MSVTGTSWGASPQIWKRYSDSVGTQILTSLLGVCTGILLPRLLGPKGRGDLAVILLWPVALDFFGSMGLYRSIVYFAAKYRQDLSRLVSVCAVLALAQSALVVAAGIVILPLALKNYDPQIRKTCYVFLLFAPIRQLAILEGQLLLGVLDTKWYNACLALPVASYALGAALLYFWNLPSIAGIVAFHMAGIALAAALGFHVIRRKLNPRWEWHAGTATEVLRYGLKTHAGDVTSFLNQRCDQFLISFLLPGPMLGLYLAAVSLSEGLLIIPRAISGLTLASGSQCDHSGAWTWAKRSLILSVVILAPAALGLWILSPSLIPRLFGPAFHQSITPLRILVPGTSAMAITLVLYGALRSINRPEIPSYCELLGLCATVVLLALLLKPFGAVGAAIATSAAYTATLAAVLLLLWPGRRRVIGDRVPGSVLLITNLPAPYRIPVFDSVNRLSGGRLHVVFTSNEWPERTWPAPTKDLKFSWSFLRSKPPSAKVVAAWQAMNATIALLRRHRPQAVVCGGYDSAGAWISFAYCRLRRRRFVLWMESHAQCRRKHALLKYAFKRWIVSGADAIAVPGKAARDYALSLGASNENIYEVRNGFDVRAFAKRASGLDVPGEKERRGCSTIVLYAGRLVEMKGVFILLEAFLGVTKLVPGAILLIVGDGAARKAMESFCERERLGNVTFEGAKSYEEMPFYYALADVYVLPTLSDPHPLSVGEALACGTPVIVSRIAGSAKDLIREGRTGYTVSPGDVEDLTRKLLLVLRDAPGKPAMRIQCRRMMEDHSMEYTGNRLWAAVTGERTRSSELTRANFGL